jgi:hypothetical protein
VPPDETICGEKPVEAGVTICDEKPVEASAPDSVGSEQRPIGARSGAHFMKLCVRPKSFAKKNFPRIFIQKLCKKLCYYYI